MEPSFLVVQTALHLQLTGAAWGKTNQTFTFNLPLLNVNGNITPPLLEAGREEYEETDWDYLA